jgi:hypothetical protein
MKRKNKFGAPDKKGAIGGIRSPIHNNWNKGVRKF